MCAERVDGMDVGVGAVAPTHRCPDCFDDDRIAHDCLQGLASLEESESVLGSYFPASYDVEPDSVL